MYSSHLIYFEISSPTLVCHTVEMHYIFKILLLYSHAGIDQTNLVYNNDDQERVYLIVDFITPGGGVLV